LANIHVYKLAANWQNFTEIYSLSENITKSFMGLLFLTHAVGHLAPLPAELTVHGLHLKQKYA